MVHIQKNIYKMHCGRPNIQPIRKCSVRIAGKLLKMDGRYTWIASEDLCPDCCRAAGFVPVAREADVYPADSTPNLRV